MRSFKMIRKVDQTGTSGVGHVASGFDVFGLFTVLQWVSLANVADGTQRKINCLTIHSCIENVALLHGHGGKTEIVFSNGETLTDLDLLGLNPKPTQVETPNNVVSLCEYRAKRKNSSKVFGRRAE